MNLFDLTGKTALLVGYQGKLGPIWNETLRDAGAEVYGYGAPEVDFSGPDVVDYMLEIPEIVPDIIICNAAIDTPPSKTEARFFDLFEETLRVNISAHAKIIEHYLPNMIENGGGVIVLIGSIMGFRAANPANYSGGFEKPVAYNLSKAALRHFAACLTKQYGQHGIRAVCPSFGPVDTGKLSQDFLKTIAHKIPLGRPVSVDSLKRTLLYACCCEDLAGTSWLVDGGYCT